ncbi:MAG: UrcA family protein [Proteobacteria bacterium]|nr:UrcA family protein [Pseudomonadota bacterium]
MNIIKSIPGSFRTVALAALACTVCSTPGWSATPASVTVKYGDLDLTSRAGASTLYHRIQGAARYVCGVEGQSLVEVIRWRACVSDATGEAVERVNSPLLTALHTGQRPAPATAMLAK